jgi:hypothetical protein
VARYALFAVEVHLCLLDENLVNMCRIVLAVLLGELKLTLLHIHLQTIMHHRVTIA